MARVAFRSTVEYMDEKSSDVLAKTNGSSGFLVLFRTCRGCLWQPAKNATVLVRLDTLAVIRYNMRWIPCDWMHE